MADEDDELDGYTLWGQGGPLNLAMDQEWDDLPVLDSTHKNWTVEVKIENTDPGLFDMMFGRKAPRHAAELSPVNKIIETVHQIKPQWPRDRGKHIQPGSWTLVRGTYKDKPSVFKWSRHNGKPAIYTIDMDKLN